MSRIGAVLATLALIGLCGCGQKGALFLPHQKKTRVPASQVNPAPETPAPNIAPATPATPATPAAPAATAPTAPATPPPAAP